ncbi:MAG TPA: hypothetical protein VMG08_14035 [Allosphingosinicella sp.]|nr:hypothetical protein [Allosphingosinicella sp.]
MVDYRDDPAVHLFGDSEAALSRMRRSATAAGCRIVSEALIEAAADPAADAIPGAALLVELELTTAGEMAIALLGRMEREARSGARRGIISGPPALIDLIAALAPHPDVAHLCEADEAARVAAIAAASRPPRARLRDPARDEDARLLRRVSEDVEKIRAMLAAMTERRGNGESGGAAGDAAADAAYIRAIIRGRRLRDQYFRIDLFADPAWDILLDLMAARLEGKRVPVSSLCVAAAVPATTALRWIKLLAERGLIVRIVDPTDRRRSHVALAEETARTLGAYLRQARRTGAEVG